MENRTMKVSEMARMLGLKKTESYHLVHKGYFKTYLVCGTMRIDKDSFEDWYDGQFHYKKVDGDPPGSRYSDTMSITETAKLLGVCEETVYFIIKKGWIKTAVISNKRRIYKEDFMNWYRSQDHYKMQDGDKDV